MEIKVPLLLMPQKQAIAASRYFFRSATRLQKRFSFLEKDLRRLEADITPVAYISVSILNAIFYFFLVSVLAYLVLFKMNIESAPEYSLIAGIAIGITVFFFCLAYPRWKCNKKVAKIDRDLLFAARHLRIQTTAGVPLFDAIVSATHGYGTVSEEFDKIVTNVQAGANLADSLEASAEKNPSYYYSRILWQMSNAVKAGTDIGPVLSDIVDFLADEQRIEMRNYGAQLNTIAIMYLMACIIVPTISLIFMMVISSFVDVPITDVVFLFVLGGMIFVQYMFIGLIESRRPTVAI